jgi:hypothetical protein
MVVFPLFLLVKVMYDRAVLPSCMLPKAMLDGFGTTDVLAAPDPCTANDVEPFITIVPASAPEVVGLKVTFTDKLFPGATVNGKAGWLVR